MIPEFGFRSNNLLINSNMELPQRIGLGGSAIGSSIYGLDRWFHVYYANGTLTGDSLGKTDHDILNLPNSGTGGSALLGANGVLSADTIRFAQRIEDKTLRYTQSSKLVLQMKILRRATSGLNSKVFFYINPADVSKNVWSATIVDRNSFAQIETPIRTVNPIVGDVALADMSNTVYETWYAVFDTPTNLLDGLEVGMMIQEDEGTPLPNDNFVNVTDCMLSLGSKLPSYVPISFGSYDLELLMAQRYYEKTFHPDVQPQDAIGATTGTIQCFPSSSGALNEGQDWEFKAIKRTNNPSVVTYNPFVAGSGWARIGSGDFARDVYSTSNRVATIRLNTSSPNAAHHIHATAENEL